MSHKFSAQGIPESPPRSVTSSTSQILFEAYSGLDLRHAYSEAVRTPVRLYQIWWNLAKLKLNRLSKGKPSFKKERPIANFSRQVKNWPVFKVKYLRIGSSHQDIGAAILKLKSSSFKSCIGSDFPGRETKRNTRLSDASLKHSVTAGHKN